MAVSVVAPHTDTPQEPSALQQRTAEVPTTSSVQTMEVVAPHASTTSAYGCSGCIGGGGEGGGGEGEGGGGEGGGGEGGGGLEAAPEAPPPALTVHS